jgi:hypothetical protein
MHVRAAIAIGLDCILICIILKMIAISSDSVLMNILSNQLRSAWIVYQWMLTVVLMVGSMVVLTVGSTVDSTWLCWAINLSKAFDSSAKRLLRLSTKRV